MVVTYGRPSTLPRVDFGFIAPGQLRGVTFNAASQHMWVYQLGIRGGKYTTEDPDNVTARVAVYAVDGSMNPAGRLGYSDAMTITTVMNDIAGGADNVANVGASTGPLSTAIPLSSGVRYHLAVLGTVGSLGHAMQAASRITADNEKFYNRSGLSQPPPDPFGTYTSSTEGHLVIWAVADENVAPNTPSSLSPAGTINETAPTFTADFVDANENRGDELNQFRIQVRRVADGSTFWDTTLTATSGEKAADAISRAYGGTTLVRGTAYEWRCQMSDYFSAWSAWTGWTAFTPANLGFVTTTGNPVGKIEFNEPAFFGGYWTHQASEDMTVVQTRLLNGAGTTVLQTGAEYNIADVASSASPGTLFTVGWASTGFTTLAWGTSYQYQMRGKDASSLWSDWSTPCAFTTDAAPTVPSGLSPANSTILTDYPDLICYASDTDDTTASGLTVFARIKNSGGTVLDTVTMTYDAGNGWWEYQTDASDLATFATYKWDAYSYDGTLYSGEATSSGAATKSSEATFVFAEGPTVTVTAPADGATITTSNLLVTWTTTDQVKYRVLLYADGSTTVVYDSGEITSAVGSHTIPSGYLRNDTLYDLVVWVEDDTPLEGQSEVIDITVDYVEPDLVANFVALPVKITTDIWESAVQLTWDQTAYGTDVWQGYTLTRTAPLGSADAGTVELARLSSPASVFFIDYLPASGVEYTYAITQTILTGLDELTSVPVEATASVTLGGVVLCSTASPGTIRTNLRYTRERDFTRRIDEAIYVPLSGEEPTTVRSPSRIREPDFVAQLFDDTAATAAVRRDELEAIDISAHTLCYRDNHGRKLFCVLSKYRLTDQVPDWYTADLGLRAERFTEGAV
jgi:hypothetical protein